MLVSPSRKQSTELRLWRHKPGSHLFRRLNGSDVIVRRLLLDTGPMRTDKTTVASFALLDRPCADIGKLLVNDVPVCKAAGGSALDCVAALNLSSRGAVPLAK